MFIGQGKLFFVLSQSRILGKLPLLLNSIINNLLGHNTVISN
jgi:hypothetical protein